MSNPLKGFPLSDWNNVAVHWTVFRLEQLKEFHLADHDNFAEIFKEKQQFGRFNLKIYLSVASFRMTEMMRS